MVICEVSAEAVRAVGGLPDASFDELMGIFEIHKDQILAVASAKYDAGDHRPCVTADDFAAVYAEGACSAVPSWAFAATSVP
jgi:hypothetical protein